MLPILNIALRAARQFNEYANLSIDRKEHAAGDLKEDLKLVRHLEEVLFKTLMDALKKGYPTHYVAEPGEQLSTDKDDAWFILGFDNEQHLTRKLPDTVYSLVYKKKGKAHASLVINPFTGAEYVAVKGSGATFNDRRCRVSGLRTLEGAYITCDAQNRVDASNDSDVFPNLIQDLGTSNALIRTSNCPTLDLAMVASGQLDAAILFDVKPEDLQAAILVCQEAGALIGDLSNGLLSGGAKTLLVANPKLFKAALQRFASYGKTLS